MDNSRNNTKNISMSAVRKLLQELDCDDENLSDAERMHVYEVLITNSENTASVESEHDDDSSTSGDSSTSNSDQSENTSEASEENEVPSESDKTKSPCNQNKESVQKHDVVDVFSSIPTTHKLLEPISVKPQYKPPFYCDSKIVNMNYEDRAKKIAEYHLKSWRSYENYQHQSINFAPWGKPIRSNSHFNGNLLRKIEKVPKDDIGHQIKQKLNSEQEDSDNNKEPKKNKLSASNSISFKNEVIVVTDFHMEEGGRTSLLKDRNSEDVTRSGHQIKRKLNAEHEDSDNYNESKKNKLSSSNNNQSTNRHSLKNEEIVEADVHMEEGGRQSLLKDRNSGDDLEIYVTQSRHQIKQKLNAEHEDSDNYESKKNKLSSSNNNKTINQSKSFTDVTIINKAITGVEPTQEEQKEKVEKCQETLDDEKKDDSSDVFRTI